MGETQEKTATHQNGASPHLKHHLQLKTKEAVEGRRLGLQWGGRKFTWRWSSKCLVNKCLLGLQRQWDPGILTDSAGFLSVYTASSHYGCLRRVSLPGTGPLGTLFRQSERMSEFLPESFEP